MDWFLQILGLQGKEAMIPVMMIGAIGLGPLYRLFKAPPSLQIILNLAIGLYASSSIWGLEGTVAVVLIAFTSYLLVYGQRFGVPASLPCWLSMICLCVFHVKRMIESYMGWNVDISTLLMLLVARVSTFSYDWKDGRETSSNLWAIRGSFPNPILFLSYIFSPFTLVAGPPLLFRQYTDAIFESSPSSPKTRRTIPFLKALASAIFAGCCLAMQSRYIYLRTEFWISDEFAELSWISKICIIHFGMLCLRSKYYVAWSLAELACISGGFAGKDDRAKNADILAIESASSIQYALNTWNRGTAYWLKNYVFKRSGFKSKTASMALTRLVSAFWHGFYPGYYLTFGFLLLADKAEGAARRYLNPFFEKGKRGKLYNFVSVIATQFALTYYGIPFQVLSFERGYLVWKRLGFAGHIIHLTAILLLPLIGRAISTKPKLQ